MGMDPDPCQELRNHEYNEGNLDPIRKYLDPCRQKGQFWFLKALFSIRNCLEVFEFMFFHCKFFINCWVL